MPFPLIAALIGAGTSLLAARREANAARDASAVQERTARENREMAEEATSAGISDFDTALDAALGRLDTASGAATAGFDTAVGYQQPFYDTGTAALSEIAAAMGLRGPEEAAAALSRFRDAPGYQFQLEQGVNALDRSAASQGGLYSGAQGMALTEYGQGLADQTFNARLSQLAGLAGVGQNAAGNLSSIAMNRGQTEGAYQGAAADALLGTAAGKANLRMAGTGAAMGANTDIGAAQAGGIIGPANAWTNAATNISTMLGYGGGEGFSTPLLDAWRARNGTVAA
jgi:hypothetical protein